MARKRPPGAKRGSPTERKPVDLWSNDARAVMHRIQNARPVVTCAPDAIDEVVWAAGGFMEEATWDPALPRFSLFTGEDEQGNAMLMMFGVSFEVRSILRRHLEQHPKAKEWNVWDATTDWQGNPT